MGLINNNNRMQNNYFSSMENRFKTDNFIVNVNPEQIQRAAKNRIFREMAGGNIDYTQYGKYFLDSKFLENLIVAATNELTNNSCVLAALREYDYNHPGDTVVIYNITSYNAKCNGYITILDALNGVKMTQNIGFLTDLRYKLSSARDIF